MVQSILMVKDDANNLVAVYTLPPLGQAAKAGSLPVAIASDDELLAAVKGTLSVAVTMPAAVSAPLTGSTGASGAAGPFTPQRGRALALKLWGTWSGSVQVKSSIDGGTTKLPLTVGGQAWGLFTGPVINEAEVIVPTIAGETFFLDIMIASGNLSYWMGQ